MAHVQRCVYGDWTFWRKVKAIEPAPTAHIISASAFTFASAYRSSDKYSRGLLWLSDAVKQHLPGFVLRVYCDTSIEPAALRRAGRHKEEAAWEETFAYIESQPHVDVIWFQHARFVAPDGAGHVDLFGTFARFMPMFHGHGLPAWAGCPVQQPGASQPIVASSDVDFGDYATEHALLHSLQWLAGGQATAACAASSVPPVSLFGLAAAGSAAARHSPSAGLPPIYSGLLVNMQRWPIAWFDSFLNDAVDQLTTGSSRLLSRYLAAIHDPARRNATYEKRRVAQQRLMPFGIDEFFFTDIIKPLCMTSADARTWAFLMIPAVDVEVSKLLSLVHAGLTQRPGIASEDSLQEVLSGLAVAAGAEGLLASERQSWIAAAQSSGDDAMADKACIDAVAAWRSSWPKAAADRVALWSRFSEKGRFDAIEADQAPSVAAGLRRAMTGVLACMATGLIPHDQEDLEQAMQNVQYFASVSPALCAVQSFSVGQGMVVPQATGSALQSEIMSALLGSQGCGIIRPAHNAGEQAIAARGRGTYVSAVALGRTAGAVAPAAAVPAPAMVAPAGSASAPAAQPFVPPVAGVKRPRDEQDGDSASDDTWQARNVQVNDTYHGWTLCLSRSSGKLYWFQPGAGPSAQGVSLWHDPQLPEGWAFELARPDAPKKFVNLQTGEKADNVPA